MAAFWNWSGEEGAAVQETGSTVLRVDDALDFGLEALADFVKEPLQRPIV